MKKSLKTMLGVTLLEIMLVLAIAGIIIAMSVRYYYQASTNQKITAAVAGITAMVSAVEQWRLKGEPIGDLQSGEIQGYFGPETVPKSPWDSKPMDAVGNSNGKSYDIITATDDTGACQALAGQMSGQPGYSGKCAGTTVTINVQTNPNAPGTG
jgi:Tfp pilus assembly protein PilE